MSRTRRCRRCRARLPDSALYCGRCGTRQERSWPSPQTEDQELRPGWFADPFKRHRFRYWNGEIWTDRVYTGTFQRDLLTLDEAGTDRPHDGSWPATPGSLALSIAGLLVSFGLSILIVLPYLFLGHPGGVPTALVLSEAGLWIGLLGTCVVTSHRYGTGKVIADFRVRFLPSDLGIGLAGALVARVFATVALLPFVHVLRSAGNPDASLDSVVSNGWLGWFILAGLTCVGAPLFEELFFRGLLQGQLAERFGPITAITATSIVFGAAHIANDPGVAGLLLALSVGASGVVLGVVRHLTGRLGSSMATHALFNAMAVATLAAVTGT